MDDLTSRALLLARGILACLKEAGFHYQLAGSLALHAHQIAGAAATNEIRLFTEDSYWGVSPTSLAAEVLRQEGHQVHEGDNQTVRSGTYPTLMVKLREGGLPLRVTLQRMPQIAQTQDASGIPAAPVADCLRRTLDALYAGTGSGAAFVDFDAIQKHAGRESFDQFVQEFLQHKIKHHRPEHNDTAPPARHHDVLFGRLAVVMRHPVNAFEHYGHPAPEALRQSVLQAALRMLRAAPGGSSLLHAPLERLQQVRLAQVVYQFDSAFPDGPPPLEPGMAAHYAEMALAVEAAVRARTQAGQDRTRIPSRHRLAHLHPHHLQAPGHGPSPLPDR
ncbi:hypothetical protein [Streptomyces chartreusis]|uniref:hypothetical protein n=1 Tax=Streptomyces chartreusis TaxID=1969 RepID=UPI002F90B701|nr:hypothetical protein OG938_44210 [Streptomyces chartreusis]WSZ73440.1 hypothetical protein OG938_47585 [Streptomyces chartreusis]WTA33700.1 hypothetical protein OIA45_48165 [Streptomyces chartreusis]